MVGVDSDLFAAETISEQIFCNLVVAGGKEQAGDCISGGASEMFLEIRKFLNVGQVSRVDAGRKHVDEFRPFQDVARKNWKLQFWQVDLQL